MNIENVQRLIEAIEGSEQCVDMRKIYHGCGTPSCIGGHAWSLMSDKPEWTNWRIFDSKLLVAKLSEFLGIDSKDANQLVFPHDDLDNPIYSLPLSSPFSIKKSDVIGVLENLLRTGIVEWPLYDFTESVPAQ